MEVGAILTRAWELFTKNPGLVIGTMLVTIVPSVLISIANEVMKFGMADIDRQAASAVAIISIVLQVASSLVSIYLQLGAVQIYVRLARGLEANIGMVTAGGPYFAAGLLGSFLVGAGTMLGMLLLVIPGIIFAIGAQFMLYALVDQDLDAVAAIKESWRLTDGSKAMVFGVNLVLVLGFVAVSCVTLGIGYFLAMPVLVLTQAVMYHSLVHSRGLAAA
jgi:uncharacterized membrane protein